MLPMIIYFGAVLCPFCGVGLSVVVELASSAHEFLLLLPLGFACKKEELQRK